MVNKALLIIIALSVVIWVLIEVKRLKHKLVALLMIGFLLFSYFGFMLSIKDKDLDLMTKEGMIDASKIYFAWIKTVMSNVKIITTNAIRLDWRGEQKEHKENSSESS